MDSDFIHISKGGLDLGVAGPGTYYKGTRFDWTGIFRSICKDGVAMADRWYDADDPYRHDNVCGPSEEFAPFWLDDSHCVKIGVGLLRVPGGREAYDRFKLYEVIRPGVFDVSKEDDRLVFRHSLEGIYVYEKEIVLVSEDAFSINHRLKWLLDEAYSGDCYNHNFFTFDRDDVGPDRRIIFDGPPAGVWREDSVNARIEGCAITFDSGMPVGCKAFIGRLIVQGCMDRAYHFRICDRARSVEVSCDSPMDHAVFWSNDRVACVEPYVLLSLRKGEPSGWSIGYKFAI